MWSGLESGGLGKEEHRCECRLIYMDLVMGTCGNFHLDFFFNKSQIHLLSWEDLENWSMQTIVDFKVFLYLMEREIGEIELVQEAEMDVQSRLSTINNNDFNLFPGFIFYFISFHFCYCS